MLSEKNLKTAFALIDKDKSGKIDQEELEHVFKGVGEVSEDVWK